MERWLIRAVVLAIALTGWHTPAQERATLFITPTDDHFDVYLSAAVLKKQVPVRVVTNEESATFVLKSTAVEIQEQSTGSKVARCLFAYCAGIEDRGLASVQLLKSDENCVVVLGQQGARAEESTVARRGDRQAPERGLLPSMISSV